MWLTSRLAAIDKELGNTEGWAGLRFIEPQHGVATHVYAAFDPAMRKPEHSGAYLLETRFADPAKDTYKAHASSVEEADLLWKLSEKLVGQEFSY